MEQSKGEPSTPDSHKPWDWGMSINEFTSDFNGGTGIMIEANDLKGTIRAS